LSLTAGPLKNFGIVDEIIEEPAGGAHRQPIATAHLMRDAVTRQLNQLKKLSTEALLDARYQKYRAIGQVVEGAAV
jgi:acetyl-CoA carboxylase carboxyl transferase subunit alpha